MSEKRAKEKRRNEQKHENRAMKHFLAKQQDEIRLIWDATLELCDAVGIEKPVNLVAGEIPKALVAIKTKVDRRAETDTLEIPAQGEEE